MIAKDSYLRLLKIRIICLNAVTPTHNCVGLENDKLKVDDTVHNVGVASLN
jgi:hypothetical protein